MIRLPFKPGFCWGLILLLLVGSCYPGTSTTTSSSGGVPGSSWIVSVQPVSNTISYSNSPRVNVLITVTDNAGREAPPNTRICVTSNGGTMWYDGGDPATTYVGICSNSSNGRLWIVFIASAANSTGTITATAMGISGTATITITS